MNASQVPMVTPDFVWTDHVEFSLIRAQALTVPCPFCHAQVEQPCQNTFSGHDLRRLPAHPERLSRAE